MHRMLSRQIRRSTGLDSDQALQTAINQAASAAVLLDPFPQVQQLLRNMAPLLERMDGAYQQFDRDLELRSRSLELSSRELNQANSQLRDDIASHTLALQSLRMAANALRLDEQPRPDQEDDIEALSRLLPELVRQNLESRTALNNHRFAMDQHSIISITDLNGTILYVNEKFCRISGYSVDELVGSNHRKINSGYHGAAYFENLWSTILAGKVWHGELRNISKDGQYYWVDATIVPLNDAGGKPCQFIAIRTETTESKRMAERVARSERQYRAVVDNIREVLIRTDVQGRITFLNPAWQTITGFPVKASIGKLLGQFVSEQDQARCEQQITELISDKLEYSRIEAAFQTSGSGTRILELDLQAQRNPDGNVAGITGTLIDVTLRRQAAELLQENLALIDALFDAIPIPVFLKGANGRYKRFNKAFLDLVNVGAGQLVNQTAGDLLEVDSALVQEEFDRKASGSNHALTVEAVVRLRDGRQFDGLISKACLHSSSGEAIGLVGTIVDISNRKAEERAMLVARDAAESASRAKSDFLANMSHEIRTPMNGIIGMTDLLLEGPTSAEQREHLLLVQNSANALLSVINDILDFSKIEAGKLNIESIAFDFRQLVSDTLHPLAKRANERGLEIIVEHGQCVAERIVSDPGRVRQIITNLVDNAIKFTASGQVILRTRAIHPADGEAQLLISVVDSGIGIPVDKQKAIFDPFEQGDGSTTRKFGGTGLGLAIIRRLLGLMNGRIELHSKPGEGSTFNVFLPLLAAPSTLPAPSIQPAAGLANKGVLVSHHAGEFRQGFRILLVEDHAINRALALKILSSAGHEVVEAQDGLVALDLHAGDSFDLILMDMQMPRMGGIDATIAIRAREQGSGTRTPILALTANAMKSHEDQCLAVGMDGFLSKPFRKDALLDAVAGHARKHCATEGCGPSGGQGDTAGSTPASSELSAAAFDYRAAIAESDEEIVLLIAQLFLANTPDDLNRIAEALADGDSLIVGRLSHALSGLLGNFGATPLVILARSIEAAAAAGSLVGVDRQLTELKAGFAVLAHALENFLAAAGEPA